MRSRSSLRGVAVAALAVIAMTAAACVPPPAPASQSWTFRASQVTVNQLQDQVCVLICVNNEDEPYTLNIGFRVKIGVPNSAQTFVINNRTDAPSVGLNQTRVLTGNQQGAATFNNIKPLDLIDLANSSNKLEVVGVYTWASEEDFVGNGVAADATANLLKDGLNSTLAAGSVPSDANLILDLILSNIFGALGILAQNIPLFGLGDDVLGGGLYIGVGAKGTLANIIDGAIANVPPITFNTPFALPPSITGGGIFTLGGTKNFTQTFTGAGGQHTYGFQVAKN